LIAGKEEQIMNVSFELPRSIEQELRTNRTDINDEAREA